LIVRRFARLDDLRRESSTKLAKHPSSTRIAIIAAIATPGVTISTTIAARTARARSVMSALRVTAEASDRSLLVGGAGR